MDFEAIISGIYPLPSSSLQSLGEISNFRVYPKGSVLLRADRLEKHIYFLSRGIVRAYSAFSGKQVTFWFGTAGDPVLPMKSYISGEKSYEQIELLEDCEFYEFEISRLRSLYEKDVHLANWGRKLAEGELIKTEERLIAMQFKTARERYQDLISYRPEILLRVQLKHIASYLGMSQVSLSRIRAGFH